jgi:hypothetical protein
MCSISGWATWRSFRLRPTASWSAGSCRRDRGARERRRNEPPGAARRGAAGRRSGLQSRGRFRAGTGSAGGRCDRRLRARRVRRSQRARCRDGGVAGAVWGGAGRVRRLHAPADAQLPRPLCRPDREHALGSAARLPGRASDRGRARGRSARDGCNRPLRRRGRRHRGGDHGRARSREGDTVETLRARVQAVEHRLLPSVVRELISA